MNFTWKLQIFFFWFHYFESSTFQKENKLQFVLKLSELGQQWRLTALRSSTQYLLAAIAVVIRNKSNEHSLNQW